MARMIRLDYHRVLHVTEFPAPEGGWRARLGHWLRRLATRVDGDRSLRYRVETLPPLSRDVTDACLYAGLDLTADLLRQACRDEAAEGALRIHRPDLYADEIHDQEGRAQ